MGSATGRTTEGSGRRRHRNRYRHRSRAGLGATARPYGAAIIALLVLGLGTVTAWYAAEFVLHAYTNNGGATKAPSMHAVQRAPQWNEDVLEYFEDAAQQAKAGNITGAEVQVDEGVSEMEEARVRSKAVSRDFFGRTSAELDDILTAHPSTESAVPNSDATDLPQKPLAARLFQHITQARVELAALRAWQEALPAGADLAVNAAEAAVQGRAQTGSGSSLLPDPAPTVSANGKLRLPTGHVDIEAPRNLSKGETLDPTSLHANFLDASLMSDTSEILLPPEDRNLMDNVRVENLTIAGASQTLDGIHWRNVTFIETRLRYEDGPLDFQDVRFIRCTFGFPSDARGATIANSIALGKTSLTIQ